MKQSAIYFVEDAYGYLVSTDLFGFTETLKIWRDNDCKYEVISENKEDYVIVKLWRI